MLNVIEVKSDANNQWKFGMIGFVSMEIFDLKLICAYTDKAYFIQVCQDDATLCMHVIHFQDF